MATVYLHIGLPKTGTSAIQNFLLNNTEVLKTHGISFPDLGFRYPHTMPQRNGHFMIASYTDARDKGLTPPGADYEAGLDQVAKLGSTYNKIILSDESIWRGTPNLPGFYSRLKADLDKRGLDVRIIVYLRRQDLWVQSLWGQMVKKGITVDFHDFLTSKYSIPVDYYAYLESLSSVFGKDALIVHVYEYGQFLGAEKNIYSDFLDIFSLTLQDGFSVDEDIYNPSLNGSCLEMRRRLNTLRGIRNGHLLKSSINEIYNNKLARDASAKCTWFNPEEQAEYLAAFADSNRKVAAEYLGREDQVLFYEPLKELPSYEITTEDLLDDTILIFGRALQNLERENNALRKEQDKLRSELDKLKKDASIYKENILLYRLKRKFSNRSGKEK